MHKLNKTRLGYSFGITGVIFYLGRVTIMLIIGQSGTTWFFNSMLHGLDVTSVSQMSVPLEQTITGIVLTFVLGWVGGYMIGYIYNWRGTAKKV